MPVFQQKLESHPATTRFLQLYMIHACHEVDFMHDHEWSQHYQVCLWRQSVNPHPEEGWTLPKHASPTQGLDPSNRWLSHRSSKLKSTCCHNLNIFSWDISAITWSSTWLQQAATGNVIGARTPACMEAKVDTPSLLRTASQFSGSSWKEAKGKLYIYVYVLILFHIKCIHAEVLAGERCIGGAMAALAAASCMVFLCKTIQQTLRCTPLHIGPPPDQSLFYIFSGAPPWFLKICGDLAAVRIMHATRVKLHKYKYSSIINKTDWSWEPQGTKLKAMSESRSHVPSTMLCPPKIHMHVKFWATILLMHEK